MPVRICPDCGGKVSTTLTTCPHCGYQFSEAELASSSEPITPAEFRCIINIKRNENKKGKDIALFIYKNGEKIGEVYNGGLFTFTAKEPGQYNFIVYHPFNCPTTKPLSKANVTPATIDLDVSRTEKEINVTVDLNAGMFKSSVVVTSIERK